MRAQATAAAAAGSSSAAAAGGAATLGTALGAIAIAAVVGYVAIKSFTTSTDESVKAMQQGGQAASDMAAKVSSQTRTVDENGAHYAQWAVDTDNWISSQVFGIATTQSMTDAFNAERAAMTPLQLAQSDATIALGNLTKAQHDFLPGSQQIVDAQQRYAAATLAVTQAQAAATVSQANVDASMQAATAHFGAAAQAADGAAQATVSWAGALATLADPMASASDKVKAFAADMQGASDAPRTLLEAMNAADKSITSFADSTLKITPAMIDATGAIITTTKAGQELATGILGSAKAYDNLYGATLASAQANGQTVPASFAAAAVASEDFRQKLIEQAVQHGATRAAAKAMADQYLAIPKEVTTQISQPGMVQAVAGALGLTGAITSIPSSKSIVVSSLSDDAKTKLEDLGLTVKTLPNGQIIITADAKEADAEIERARIAASSHQALIPVGATTAGYDNALHDGVGAALTTQGANIPVGANPAGFGTAITQAVTVAGSTLATIPIDGNPAAFDGKVTQSVTLANGSTGIIALDGNPTFVNGKVQQAVVFADGSKGTITIDGNPNPANGKTTATVTFANGSKGTITINGNNSGAMAAINAVIAAASRTVVMNIVQQVTTLGKASGGILQPMAEGGILPMASGGIPSMRGGYADVVNPGVLRLIGDNMKVRESYIPHDDSARSRGILAQTATEMGFGLVPKGLADALKAAGGPAGSDGASAPSTSNVSTLSASSSPVGSGGGGGDTAAAIQAVADRLEALGQALASSRQVTNNVNVAAAVSEAADEFNRVLRRDSEMGVFQR